MKFDEYAELTRDQLGKAASLFVIAQNGLRIPFGDLFRERKTIVLFIRHFWLVSLSLNDDFFEERYIFMVYLNVIFRCPSCQDYMYSVSRSIDPEALKRAGIDLVIIGNGSPGMIRSYRRMFPS